MPEAVERTPEKAKESTPQTADLAARGRLPCRGCLPNCINYDRCEGRPWTLE
ncbi:hypothetical protein [Alkalimarinus sediminis]|uniref:Uncharacterized protein n=1 Tax=Alkalimarinus sediminis TaxID=1632866 RepID=A0A9E8HJT0_9ALTE|nr:hypothetical protein [Alkalimarinus sediminis]UZW75960.1 hypothetical protein NNL22_05095 [Alkalimarinus sediminis]